MNRMFRQQILWEGEAGGAAGGGGTAASGAAGAAAGGLAAAAAAAKPAGGDGAAAPPAAGAAAAGGGDKSAAYCPEGLPEALRGKDERETLDKVAKHLTDMPKAPGKADEYKFTPAKELGGLIDPANDKVLPMFRDVALELGLTQTQFDGTINKLYGKMMEAGLVQRPVDVNDQFTKLGGDAGDKATRIQKGMERITGLADQITGLATRGELSREQAGALVSAIGDADTTIAFERLLSLIPSAKGPQNGGTPGGTSAPTKAAVLAKMEDPRYIFSSGKFDRAFYDAVNREYEQVPRG